MKTLRPPDLPSQPARDDPMGLVGETLDGQFRVDAVIGSGGFSVVYRGFHLGLSEPVAVKAFRVQGGHGTAAVESFLRKFRDEGRILYRLSQGNLHIVRSIASGTTIAPATSAIVPYIVLEWLDGRSLAQDFDDRRAQGMTGRPLAAILTLLDSAASALAYAHESGVVHRDLNPGNIFLAETREGLRAKVLDFGIAKVVSDHVIELGPRAPTFGQLRMFSPAYAAPEQLDERVGKIAPWTDVYALAMVVLEAMRDTPALTGDSLADIYQQTLDVTRRPTPRTLGLEVSDAIEGVFARALALDPRERFLDAGEFWSTLKGLHRMSLTPATPALHTMSLPPEMQEREEAAPDTMRMESPPVTVRLPGVDSGPRAAPPVTAPPAAAPPVAPFDRTLPLQPSGPNGPSGAPPPQRPSPVDAIPPALFGPPPDAPAQAPAPHVPVVPRSALSPMSEEVTVPPRRASTSGGTTTRTRRWGTLVLAILLGAALAGIGLYALAHWLARTSSGPP